MNTKQALVADIMTVDPIVVLVDASAEEADTLIRSTTYLKSIPVVDSDGALVGVIHDADLVAYRYGLSRTLDETSTRNEATSDARPDRPAGH
jgi:CBS-domain-containing membrane protein